MPIDGCLVETRWISSAGVIGGTAGFATLAEDEAGTAEPCVQVQVSIGLHAKTMI